MNSGKAKDNRIEDQMADICLSQSLKENFQSIDALHKATMERLDRNIKETEATIEEAQHKLADMKAERDRLNRYQRFDSPFDMPPPIQPL